MQVHANAQSTLVKQKAAALLPVPSWCKRDSGCDPHRAVLLAQSTGVVQAKSQTLSKAKRPQKLGIWFEKGGSMSQYLRGTTILVFFIQGPSPSGFAEARRMQPCVRD